MSLSTNRIYLALFFLTTLISCEKPSEIGLNLQGNNQLGTYFDNKQPVTASTVVQPDSILAFKNNPVLVGKYTDPELGVISAAHYSEVNLNGTNVSFKTDPNAVADSLVLVLAYTGYYYGDTSADVTVNVHRLAENFSDTRTYFTTSKLNVVPGMPLGTKTFKPQKHRIKKAGSTADLSQVLRVKLSQNFANELLNKSGSSDLASQAAFRNYWKGIAIMPDAATNGSIIGFNTLPDSAGTLLVKVAGINLYFKDKNGDRQMHNFSLSGAYYFNGVEGNPPASLVTGGKAFVQQHTGIKTHLTFPQLESFKEQNPGIVINSAELVLSVNPPAANPKVVKTPPSAVYLYESTPSKRIRKTSGGVSYSIQRGNNSALGFGNPLRLSYNTDSSFYKGDVTGYIQALIANKKANNGIIVSGIAEDAFTASATGVGYPGIVSVNQAEFILSGSKNLKLRIYYSKLN